MKDCYRFEKVGAFIQLDQSVGCTIHKHEVAIEVCLIRGCKQVLHFGLDAKMMKCQKDIIEIEMLQCLPVEDEVR